MTLRILKVPIGLRGHAKDRGVRNIGTDTSARTVHIRKKMSKCISDLYIAMNHLRISKFSEPPVFIILLVSPPLIYAESVRFDVISTEKCSYFFGDCRWKKLDNCLSHV